MLEDLQEHITNLVCECKMLEQQLKKKDEVIEKAIVYAESSSFEVYTKDYGTLEVCNAIDVLDILKEVE